MQKARPKTLERFFNDRNSRNADKTNMRLEEIRRAVTATHDSAVIIASSSAALALVKILREIRDAISSYDWQIEKLTQAHPDYLIFDSFPCAGAALVPRLIAAFGTCRDAIEQLGNSVLQRNRTRCRKQWKAALGSLSSVLSQVLAPDLS